MKRFKYTAGALLIILGIMANLLFPLPVQATSALNGNPQGAEASANTQNVATSTQEADPIRVIVKYKKKGSRENVKARIKKKLRLKKLESRKKSGAENASLLKSAGAAPQGNTTSSEQSTLDVLEVTKGDDIGSVVDALKSDPDVEYAQPNYKLAVQAVPQDPRYSEQWGLKNRAQSVEGLLGRNAVDINAENAWNLTKGSSSVLIGVLDTGIDTTHIDLKNAIFVNTKEIPNNGIDDDGNGYIDDVNGWDFVNKDKSVFDSSVLDLHGTQVAGIIAASANTNGVTGVAPNVKILPLKFINGNWGYTCDAIDAIEYAITNSGMLFVCSAGNRGMDVAVSPVYPACFGIPNVLSVASVDSMGVLSKYSSFGSKISVAAPGINILSTAPNGNYDYLSGTSASAPLVTGVVALLKSKEPSLGFAALAQRVKSSVVPCTNLTGKVSSGGRVDAYAALTNTKPVADSYSGPGNDTGTVAAGQQGGNIDTWYTLDQLAKIKEKLHYGESGVNPASGNYSLTATDMSVPAPGFQVNISRTYNSRDDVHALIGHGWTFGFEGKLTGSGVVFEASLPNGSTQRFRLIDATYQPEDSRSTLVKNADGRFTLTTKDQYKYTFGTNTFLTKMEDPNGNAVTIGVAADGKINSITDAVNRVYTVHYNASGRIDLITDVEGRTIKYEYNANYQLIKVTDAMGNIMSYDYDTWGFLTEVRDHNGNAVVKLYYNHAEGENQHKVSMSINSLGDTVNYSYDTLNKKSTASSTGGRVTTYWYDTEMYIVKTQEPDGKDSSTEYYDVGGKNKYGDVKTVTDRNGNKTYYDIDDRGNVTKVTNPDGSTKEFAYDELNNKVMEKDEAGVVSYYAYADYGAYKRILVKKAQPLNGTDVYTTGVDESKFAVTNYTYYSASEALTQFGCSGKALQRSVIDPLGNETLYTYDVDANMKTAKDPEGKTTTYTYNRIGQKTKVVTPMGFKTDVVYDKNGLPEKIVLHNGETTRMVYDTSGRMVQEIGPNIYDAAKDNLAGHTYSDAAVGTRYTYYLSGLVNTMIDAAGNTTSYYYDVFGNKTKEVRPNGSIYTYEYDNLDRLKKTYFQSTSASTKVLQSETSYSITADKMTQKTDTRYLNATDKAVTVYLFDYKDRLIQTQYPDGTVEKTSYNPDGTVASTTGKDGRTTLYKYDVFKHVTAQWAPLEVSGGTVLYSYVQLDYDKAGRKISEKKGKDKVAALELPTSFVTQSFDYLRNGDLIRVTDGEGRKTEYTYDLDGNKTSESVYTDASNKLVTEYTYNHLKKPTQKKKHVALGNLYGNAVTSTADTILLSTFTCDNVGNLKTVTSPSGVVTTYTYDALNRLISTSEPGTDENGTSVTITNSTTYDFEGKPLTKTDANGKVTTFAYDAEGHLTKVTDALGGITSYGYDLAGRKTLEVTPKNYESGKALIDMSRVQYDYDLMDRLVSKLDIYRAPGSSTMTVLHTITLQYEVNGKVIKEMDARGYDAGTGTSLSERLSTGFGITTTYNLGGCVQSVLDAVSADKQMSYAKKFEYDGLGRKTAEVSSTGVRTEYVYDDSGNVKIISIKKSDNASAVVMKSMTYDLAGRMLTETDGNGNTTTTTYSTFGTPRTITTPGDSTISSQTTTFQYDTLGNLKSSLDTTGKLATFTYDKQKRLIGYKEMKTDGSDVITKSVAFDKAGNKRFETDARGTVKENTFDALGRLIQSKVTVSGIAKVTKFDFDANSNQTTLTDYLGNIYTNVYDPLNRLIEKKDPYTTIQKLEYTANSLQSKSTDALGNVTQFNYDEDGRLIATTDPENHTTSQSFDDEGNLCSKMDGRGTVISYVYDELNRLVQVRNAKGEVTSYTYDNCGNKLTQTDGAGNITTFEYNAQNKVIRKIDHGGRVGVLGSYSYIADKTETYTYNPDGTLKTKTDRNGKVTAYTYDIHGRLIKKAIGSVSISYTYDTASNVLNLTDATGTTTRTYDEENRVLTKTVPIIGKSTYTYDTAEAAGTYSELTTDPKGNVTKKVYDKAGRLIQVIEGTNTTTYTYLANGKRSSVIYPSGAKEVYTYLKDGLIQTLTNTKANGTILDAYSYTYDGAHNQTSKTDGRGITKYDYDVLNRLAKVIEPARNGQPERITTYLFDAAGNRLQQTILQGTSCTATTYTYNEQNRLVMTLERSGDTGITETYDYDNNGNVMSKVKETVKTATAGTGAKFSDPFKAGSIPNSDVAFYTYDVWNNLASSIEGDKTAKYAYNGDGYRTEKNVNGQITRYLYEADKVVLETDGAGNQVARNVYGNNLLLRKVDGQTLYYMYNGHGDVTALIDSAGTTKGTYYYDAFGNIVEDTSNGLNNPILYAGYQYDKESGLYYLNARSYDPVTARFMQEDTYAGNPNDPLSLNLYAYCHNEPVMYEDPTGHISIPTANDEDAKTYKKSQQDMAKKVNKDWKKVTKIATPIVKLATKWLKASENVGAQTISQLGLGSLELANDVNNIYMASKNPCLKNMEAAKKSLNTFKTAVMNAPGEMSDNACYVFDAQNIDNFFNPNQKQADADLYLQKLVDVWLSFEGARGSALALEKKAGSTAAKTAKKGGTASGAGANRAAKFAENWQQSSLDDALEKFAPNSNPVTTSSGKTLFKNEGTGIQVVYDKSGNYFRIEDTTIAGKRRYLDLDGNNVSNKIVDGKQMGRTKDEYEAITHFLNTK